MEWSNKDMDDLREQMLIIFLIYPGTNTDSYGSSSLDFFTSLPHVEMSPKFLENCRNYKKKQLLVVVTSKLSIQVFDENI